MAINKTLNLESGISANYHKLARIPAIENQSGDKEYEIICEVYLNKSARENLKEPVTFIKHKIIISKEETLLTTQDMFELVYNKLMQLNYYSGATIE
jgi:hypothetical protein